MYSLNYLVLHFKKIFENKEWPCLASKNFEILVQVNKAVFEITLVWVLVRSVYCRSEKYSRHPSLVSNALVIYNSFWRYTLGYCITLLALCMCWDCWVLIHTHLHPWKFMVVVSPLTAACIGEQYLISHTNEVGEYSSENDACIWKCFNNFIHL